MKTNNKIHHELIGTVPTVEGLRDTLDEIICRFETNLNNQALKSTFNIHEALKDPATREHICDGAVIELCAAHFYGLKREDYADTIELIAAINGIEDELRNRA